MYLDQKISPISAQPEHLSAAMQFSNEILERYQPHEANEIIKLIRQRWSEHRLLEIEKAEKHIEYLKKTLTDL